MSHPLMVLKFGSSVLRTEADLPGAVHEIYKWLRKGHRVAAVVSALGETTDRLLAQTLNFGDSQNEEAAAALIATGEHTCGALLGLALDRAGVPCRVLDSAALGLRAEGQLLDSTPVAFDSLELDRAFGKTPVVSVRGCLG